MKNLRTGEPLNVRSSYKSFYSDTFAYVASFDPIAAGETVTCFLQLQNDANFEWQKTTARARAGRKIEDPLKIPVSIMIIDSGAGRLLFNKPIPIGLLAGRGKPPATLPTTRIFRRGAIIKIEATNHSNRKMAMFEVAFIGCKIFAETPHD